MPFTIHDVEDDIRELECYKKQLRERSNEYRELAVEAVNAENDFNRAYSLALFALSPKEVHGKEKVIGLPDIADLRLKMKKAEAIQKACSKSMDNLNSAIDAMRTIISLKKDIINLK
jgi:hypothetical protein